MYNSIYSNNQPVIVTTIYFKMTHNNMTIILKNVKNKFLANKQTKRAIMKTKKYALNLIELTKSLLICMNFKYMILNETS